MNAKAKKIMVGAGALTLTAAISITGTVAYLTHITEQRVNNFTFAVEGLNATLTEPKWDGVVDYEYTDDGKVIPVFGYQEEDPEKPIYGYEGGNKDNPITDPKDPKLTGKSIEELRPKTDDEDNPIDYGDKNAQGMTPGTVAGKDPFITNNGEMNEWVAAQVSFVYGEGSYEDKNNNGIKDEGDVDRAGKLLTEADFEAVTDVIDIAWTTTENVSALIDPAEGEYTPNGKWYYDGAETLADSYKKQMVFYYDKALAAESRDKTAAIFSSVTLDKDATTEQVKKLEKMGGFAIYIQGYAVQESEFENGYKWCTSEDVAKFDNSPTEETGVTVTQPGIIGSPDNLTAAE